MPFLVWGKIMERREFITVLGGAVATWPLTAHAEAHQPRRIGFLSQGSGPSRSVEAFRDGLRALGYVEGQTILND
jgi:putative ABC transport system substrate-binding protein